MVKQAEIKGPFEKYVTTAPKIQDTTVKENLLLQQLPRHFLPVRPQLVLLMISDSLQAYAIDNTQIFRRWDHAGDAFSIELQMGT
jgi:hypothetical protein